jgi:cytochrome P450/NADPH:quinone reductase-like Zn-dependent oxidoreductase
VKAFVIDRYKPADGGRLAELPDPVPGAGQVLVEAHAAGVNPLDARIRAGEFRLFLRQRMPLVLGNDVAGVVIAVGPGVQRIRIGDEVYARSKDAVGTFAELVALDEADVAHKPATLPMAEAASVPLVGLTAWQALVERAKLRAGERVFVEAGSGGVGTFAIQLAKHLGATVATTASAANAELVEGLGADVVVDYRRQDVAAVLADYDVVLHNQDAKALDKAMRILKPRGRLISISGPPDPSFATQVGAPSFLRPIVCAISTRTLFRAKQRHVEYRFVFVRADGAQLSEIAAILDAGAIRPVIDRTFPFDATRDTRHHRLRRVRPLTRQDRRHRALNGGQAHETERTKRNMATLDNWTQDYDVFDPDYVANPYPIWDDLRASCPVAHTERYGGSWMTTTYDDVTRVAPDPDAFSSRNVSVVPPPDDTEGELFPSGLPPIQADPPVHTWSRRLVLPWFSHDRVAEYEPHTRELCRSLLDGFASTGRADAAGDYAKQIPVRVIGKILGIPEEKSDTFIEWVRSVLEFANDVPRRDQAQIESAAYFIELMNQRRGGDGIDLISELLRAEVDGNAVPDDFILGVVALVLIAGLDTTWSALGSMLLHLAEHPDDARRLVEEPNLLPTAIEEMLRAYSPVTMARIAADDVDLHGCPVKQGDRVLVNFPAANRDPGAFADADQVILDRQMNRHVAFGAGIHRCAGSNLARMELRVGLEEWLARIPTFRLEEGRQVSWAGGQVRGPREVPVVFP